MSLRIILVRLPIMDFGDKKESVKTCMITNSSIAMDVVRGRDVKSTI
jgi:hypothetical protein